MPNYNRFGRPMSARCLHGNLYNRSVPEHHLVALTKILHCLLHSFSHKTAVILCENVQKYRYNSKKKCPPKIWHLYNSIIFFTLGSIEIWKMPILQIKCHFEHFTDAYAHYFSNCWHIILKMHFRRNSAELWGTSVQWQHEEAGPAQQKHSNRNQNLIDI